MSGTWVPQAELTATAGAAGDLFGTAVGVMERQRLSALKEMLCNQGGTYVFKFGTGWTQSQKLTATVGRGGRPFWILHFHGDDGRNMVLIGAPGRLIHRCAPSSSQLHVWIDDAAVEAIEQPERDGLISSVPRSRWTGRLP